MGDTPIDKVLPKYNTEIINNLSFFIVENIRTSRRFLKKCNPEIDIDALTFYELNKRTLSKDIATFLNPMRMGESIGFPREEQHCVQDAHLAEKKLIAMRYRSGAEQKMCDIRN